MTDDQTALDEVLKYFDPGPRARMCGDGERADIHDQARAELTALRARVAALEKACDDVLKHMVGDMPASGWMRDNNESRSALRSLRAAREASR